MDSISGDDAAPAPLRRSLPRRVLDTFVSPGVLFADFGARPPWIGPLAISTVATIAAFTAIPSKLYVEQIRQGLQNGPQTGAAPDPESIVGIARIGALVSAAFSPLLSALLAAGALTLVFGVLLGGAATFRQHFAAAAHAALIPALGALLTLPLWLATGSLETRLSLSLVTPFLDPESPSHRVLEGLEVFTLWWIAVLALGVAALNRNIGWGKAAAILFGVYLVILVAVAVVAS